jgi:hypothetical protein
MSDLIAQSLAELLQMCRDDPRDWSCEDRSPFLETNKKRVREIGEALNEVYGFSGMIFVCEQMPVHDQRELEVAWDEIGDWQC